MPLFGGSFSTINFYLFKLLKYGFIPFVIQKSSQYPGFVLSAASLVPGAGVVVGTSAGNVHLMKSSATELQSLSTMDSIPGQVNH